MTGRFRKLLTVAALICGLALAPGTALADGRIGEEPSRGGTQTLEASSPAPRLPTVEAAVPEGSRNCDEGSAIVSRGESTRGSDGTARGGSRDEEADPKSSQRSVAEWARRRAASWVHKPGPVRDLIVELDLEGALRG